MYNIRSFILLTIVFAFSIVAVTAQGDSELDRIVINHTNLFPEGIAYDETHNRFLVGSWGEGKIFVVADNGTLTPFIEDDALVQPSGLEIAVTQNQLLVANFNPSAQVEEGSKFPVSVVVFDLETGKRLHFYELENLLPDTFSFVNDVTIDGDGNIYVTDSPAGAIYKVDTNGEASVFVQDERFIDQPVGLNGIEYHSDGYLIVGVAGSPPALYTVSLDEQPIIHEIATEIPIGNDGITLHPDGSLIVAGANLHGSTDFADWEWTTFTLSSNDNWKSATIVGEHSYDRFGSTVAIRDGIPYTVLSDVIVYGPVMQGNMDPIETFEVIRINTD